MIQCPQCHGEGKVRTAPEERLLLLRQLGAFAALWGRRAALVAIVGVLPFVGIATFYGLAWFISQLTGADLREPAFREDILGHVNRVRDAGSATGWVLLFVGTGVLGGIAAAIGMATEVVVPRWKR
jgi:hypothetical protein